jgi:ParB family chromosome partitioning protein
LRPSPEQPRKHFDPARLEELTTSIRNQGLLQPIVITPAADDGAQSGDAPWLIVAGERRWRAAQKAGLHEVPVFVREQTDERQRLEMALVENIQRADLNPIEEARAYAALIDIADYTQEDLAQRVGKDRSTIANAIRLLRLPDRVQQMVVTGQLSMGHARALLGLPREDDINALASAVVHEGLSVRATEQAVRKRATPAKRPPTENDEAERRKVIVGELENRLRRRLGVRVRMRAAGAKGAGVVEIPYASLDELDRLLQVIFGDPSGVGSVG